MRSDLPSCIVSTRGPEVLARAALPPAAAAGRRAARRAACCGRELQGSRADERACIFRSAESGDDEKENVRQMAVCSCSMLFTLQKGCAIQLDGIIDTMLRFLSNTTAYDVETWLGVQLHLDCGLP